MPKRKKSKDDSQQALSFGEGVEETAAAEPAGGNGEDGGGGRFHDVVHVDEMFREWYRDYGSYVILERAVPQLRDGLKPVQRRILHSLREMDDGRFNKAANVVGHTMKYHPHGDAAIGDALVGMGQKELLVDTQGNWGDPVTGSPAAAPRYIEARLSPFAREVLFNGKLTEWVASYDGRSKEPLQLPVKFPLVLLMGVEGIAVTLASRILPHNFGELLDACVSALRKEPFTLYPDFPTGGMADVSDYNEGKSGGRVRVRAKIEVRKKSLLAITEIPFGTNTNTLIASILRETDKGRVKVSRVEDLTAANVEILLHLPTGSDPEQTVQALYAFTDCEVSLAPNACVIDAHKPHFSSVHDMLKTCAEHTRELLKRELEIELSELREKWHFASLEKIFIEKRIYRDIEQCETWEAVLAAIDKGLKPHVKHLLREVTREDLVKLTEIRIKRISKFDSTRADEEIAALEGKIEEAEKNLRNLTKYTIRHFENLKQKYGPGRERRTELVSFDRVVAREVAAATETLYVNRKEGFAGTSLRKDETVGRCSTLDDVLTISSEGVLRLTRVAEKAYVGAGVEHIEIFDKEADPVFCLVYRDGKGGRTYAKKFRPGGLTRDREYDLTKGTAGSRVLFLQRLLEGEADPKVVVHLRPAPRLRKTEIEVDFGGIGEKNRGAQGNIVAKNPVARVSRARGEKAAAPSEE